MNQWNEVVGKESSGKSAAVAKTVAANQALDPRWTCAWIDAEGCYDGPWMAALGVDNERVIVVEENGMEQVYDTTMRFLDSRLVDCVVIDSLPALAPTSEDENDMETFHVGLHARLTGKFFRKQRKSIRRSLTEEDRPVLALMINQWRDKIGVMFGDPRTTPGGNGKNFFYVVRVEVKRVDWIADKKIRYGQTIGFSVFKNKTARPHGEGVVDFYFADFEGFQAGEYDRVKEVIDLGVAKGYVTVKAGGIYEYAGNKWKGRPALVSGIKGAPDVQAAIESDVLGTPIPMLAARAAKKTAKVVVKKI